MTQRIAANLLLGAATALLTTSCAKWKDMSSYEHAVWSDDGDKIAAVKSYYEGKATISHIKRRNIESELRLSDASSPNALASLTPILEGDVKALYYMHSEGYLVFGRMLEEVEVTTGATAGSTTREIIFDKITLDGTMTEIDRVDEIAMLSCDGGQSSTSTVGPLEIVPSPDGSVLAVVKTVADCTQTGEMTVSFRDADSLAVIDGPKTVDLDPLLSDNPFGGSLTGGFLISGWSTDGKFILTHAGTPDGGWAYAPGENAEWRDGIDDGCVFPATTSSQYNAQTQYLELDYNATSAPLTIVDASADPGAQTFGCP